MEPVPGITVSFILAIVFVAGPRETESKWVESTIITDSDWMFVTRFCFLSSVGNMNYLLEYPTGFGVENLLFYYDVPGQWSSVYQQDLTCEEKMKVLSGKNLFPLNESDSMCEIRVRNDWHWYVCTGDIDFSTARERWWYIAVSKCGSQDNLTEKGIYLHYKLHMTNGDDLLHKEFSADEFYILVVDMVFLGLYLILASVSAVCAVILKRRQMLNSTYKLYLVSVMIWTAGLVCLVIAWLYYGITGWSVGPLEVCGRILQTCSNVIFIVALILVAKGYSVIRNSLSRASVIKMTIFVVLYIAAMVVMFVWESIIFDPGVVLYYYESPPGYGMLTVILIGWLWFTKAAVFTLKHFSSRTGFYIKLYTVYTIWFWASPFVVLLAVFAMAKWTREKTVNGVQEFIAFVGHFFFLILMFPSKTKSNVPPYQVRKLELMCADKIVGQDGQVFSMCSDDPFPGCGTDVGIAVKSKDVRAREDQKRAMLYVPVTSSCDSSDEGISLGFTQTTHPNSSHPSMCSTFTGKENSNSLADQLQDDDEEAADEGDSCPPSPKSTTVNGE